MCLLVLFQDLIDQHIFMPDIVGMDMLTCSDKEHEFFIRLAVTQIGEMFIFEHFDRGMKSYIPHPDGIVLAGCEEHILIMSGYRNDALCMC